MQLIPASVSTLYFLAQHSPFLINEPMCQVHLEHDLRCSLGQPLFVFHCRSDALWYETHHKREPPGQGISRRSCMLMRRILLEVGRGVRRRVNRLGSCLHSPGADQAESNIPCPMRFYYLMIQAINSIITILCDRGFLTWSRSSRVQHSVSNAFLRWHGVDESNTNLCCC